MKRIFTFIFILTLLTSCFEKKKEKFSFEGKKVREVDKIAYALGIQYGKVTREFALDKKAEDIFIEGLREGFKTKKEKLDIKYLKYARQMDKRVQVSRKERARMKKDEGSKAVEAILKTDSDYSQTESGLLYKITKRAKNKARGLKGVTSNSMIEMKYKSKTLDDKVYESTMIGNPRKLPLKGIFKAWQEAFSLCGTNCEIEIIAPPALTYGDNGALPYVEPGEYLKYEIIFYEVEKR